jgi:hypothetical protein
MTFVMPGAAAAAKLCWLVAGTSFLPLPLNCPCPTPKY